MSATDSHANPIQTVVKKVAAIAPVSRVLSGLLHRVDGPLLRASGGRLALSSALTGAPIALVTTIGAKSGQPRTIPLVVIPKGDTLGLIGSNWGGKHYPAWYHNLRADPYAQVNLGGKTGNYLAREASGPEYDAYWAEAVRLYAGYEQYKARTGGRHIPVVVLKRVESRE